MMRLRFSILVNWLFPRRATLPSEIRERATDQFRFVMRRAGAEARRRNHEYLGTEHVLFAMTKKRSSIAASMLTTIVGDLARMRGELKKRMAPSPVRPWLTTLPLTPTLRKALKAASNEADQHNHKYIGTEHLLVGLLGEAESVAAGVVNDVGLDAEAIRLKIVAMLSGHATN